MIKARIVFFVITFILIGWIPSFDSNTQTLEVELEYSPIDSCKVWVDSVFNGLTPDERIAQLFMIRACSNKDQLYYDAITKQIKDYNIGGLCFFQGGPVRHARLANYWQSVAKTPLLVSIDGEWGLSMRLDSTFSFPRQMTLGAIQNDTLIYMMACEIAWQCKRMGIHINFAPVIDVNSNSANPVINSRSFGENRYNVTRKGFAYMKGLQNNGVMACAKHFPGHGDTDTDSHLTLPIVNNSKELIDSIHLYPFKHLIKYDLKSLMVAHLFIPSYDSTKNIATTLSKAVVTDLLKKKMDFKGLIITDALEMKGVSNYHEPGELEVKALIAGNDILLLPKDVPIAIKEIKKAIKKGSITQKEIDKRCKKVLEHKYWAGLNEYKPIDTKNLYEDLNNPKAKRIERRLYSSAVTLVKNNNDIIPFKRLDTLKLATVSIGGGEIRQFQKVLGEYTDIDQYTLVKQASAEQFNSLLKKLSEYNLVIVGIHNTSNSPKSNYGITQRSIDFINLLRKKTKVVLDVFANPYCLARFEDTENIEALLVSYQSKEVAENISAKIIMGDLPAKGKLPVTASAEFPVNTGIITKKKQRLTRVSPSALGIDSLKLLQIDSIAKNGIADSAYPGCQILAAKDGKIFYYKSFGYHTYDTTRPVKNTDLYDMASVTKIAATTLCVMKLYDEGKLDVNKTLVNYLPYLQGTNKEDVVIRKLMAHQAKLRDWIPFYLRTMNRRTGKLDTVIYRKEKSDDFPYRVAEGVYIHKYYEDSIMKRIIQSKLYDKEEYKYSDIGFYLLLKIVESLTSESFEDYVNENFYQPLGLKTMCYKPRNHFDLSRIVPTEKETDFRKQLLHGDVHDQGAAMLGGVAGHAGLFSNAEDMAVIMQMLLQGGGYNGQQYIKASTIKEFTKYQFPDNDNRRGMGFDKPFINDKGGPTCNEVSKNTFGHSGFTGTCVWADPDHNLIFVFLSNRIHPDTDNKKLADMNIRTSIQRVLYEAIKKE